MSAGGEVTPVTDSIRENGVRRRRLAPDRRRDEILAIATQLLSERGYNGVTIQSVADASGMAKSGVLHHFPSKDVLLIELLRYRDDRAVAELEIRDALDLRPEQRRAVLDALVLRNFTQRETTRLFTVLSAEALDSAHPAHDYFDERLRATRSLFRSTMEGMHPDPETATLRIIAFLDGLQLLWLRDDSVAFLELWAGFADDLLGPASPP